MVMPIGGGTGVLFLQRFNMDDTLNWTHNITYELPRIKSFSGLCSRDLGAQISAHRTMHPPCNYAAGLKR